MELERRSPYSNPAVMLGRVILYGIGWVGLIAFIIGIMCL